MVNCGTMLIVMVVRLRVKITRRCSLAGTEPTVCGQETAGTGWEAEARNRKLFDGGDLRTGVGNLFKVGLEAADWRWSAGLYGLGLRR